MDAVNDSGLLQIIPTIARTARCARRSKPIRVRMVQTAAKEHTSAAYAYRTRTVLRIAVRPLVLLPTRRAAVRKAVKEERKEARHSTEGLRR